MVAEAARIAHAQDVEGGMNERTVFEIAAVLLLFGTTAALAFTIATVTRLTAAVARLVDQIDDVEEISIGHDPDLPQQHSRLPEAITRLLAKHRRAA